MSDSTLVCAWALLPFGCSRNVCSFSGLQVRAFTLHGLSNNKRRYGILRLPEGAAPATGANVAPAEAKPPDAYCLTAVLESLAVSSKDAAQLFKLLADIGGQPIAQGVSCRTVAVAAMAGPRDVGRDHGVWAEDNTGLGTQWTRSGSGTTSAGTEVFRALVGV